MSQLWFWFAFSLMANDVELLFMCLLAIFILFEGLSIQVLCLFSVGVVVLLLNCESSLCILSISPIKTHDLEIFFSFCESYNVLK